MARSVDFPDPLGPATTDTRPPTNWAETPTSARTAPNVFVTPRSAIRSSPADARSRIDESAGDGGGVLTVAQPSRVLPEPATFETRATRRPVQACPRPRVGAVVEPDRRTPTRPEP